MKKTIVIIFTLGILFVINGCVKLPIYKSKLNENYRIDNGFSGYDKKNSLRWLITNDNSNLYLRIESLDDLTSMKILKTGLSIYIDTLGKKKKEMSIKFPLPGRLAKSTQGQNPKGKSPINNQSMSSKVDILEKIPREAIYSYNNVTESFNYLLEKETFDLNMEFTKTGDLVYNLVIPFNKIKNGGINEINKLSIGIISGTFSSSGNKSGQNSSQGKSMQQGGMKGGGGKGGGKGKGKGNKSGSSGMSAMMVPVKVWFGVELFKESN